MFIFKRQDSGVEWGDVWVPLAVTRKGSSEEAARSLGVSHPAMGRRIKALEVEARQALFCRIKEGLVLTDAGNRVLKLVEAVENPAPAMERRLAGNHERLEEILRVFCVERFANYVLAPALNELTCRHSVIVPKIIASYRLLNLSRYDAGTAFRIASFTESDIVQRRLMTIPYALYRAPDMAGIAQRDPAAVGLILMNTAQSHSSSVTRPSDRFPQSRRVFTSTSRATQVQMYRRGTRIAIPPRPFGNAITGSQSISMSEPPPSENIWVGYYPDPQYINRLRVMLDTADVLLANPGTAAT